jgi:hypothetical protein
MIPSKIPVIDPLRTKRKNNTGMKIFFFGLNSTTPISKKKSRDPALLELPNNPEKENLS